MQLAEPNSTFITVVQRPWRLRWGTSMEEDLKRSVLFERLLTVRDTMFQTYEVILERVVHTAFPLSLLSSISPWRWSYGKAAYVGGEA